MRPRLPAVAALCGLLLASSAHSHDEQLSLFQIIRFKEGKWGFQVNAPLMALARASVEAREEPLTPASAGSPEVRQQMVRYIRDGFDVSVTPGGSAADGGPAQALSLGVARVKVDDHSATMVFSIKGMPESVARVEFTFDYMAPSAETAAGEQARSDRDDPQVNRARLVDLSGDRKKMERFELTRDNGFTAEDTEFFAD